MIFARLGWERCLGFWWFFKVWWSYLCSQSWILDFSWFFLRPMISDTLFIRASQRYIVMIWRNITGVVPLEEILWTMCPFVYVSSKWRPNIWGMVVIFKGYQFEAKVGAHHHRIFMIIPYTSRGFDNIWVIIDLLTKSTTSFLFILLLVLRD